MDLATCYFCSCDLSYEAEESTIEDVCCECAEEQAAEAEDNTAETYAATAAVCREIGLSFSDRKTSQYIKSSSGTTFRLSDHQQKVGGGFRQRGDDSWGGTGDSDVSIYVENETVTVEGAKCGDREIIARFGGVPTADELFRAVIDCLHCSL